MLHHTLYIYKKSLESKYKTTKFGKSGLNAVPLDSGAIQSELFWPPFFWFVCFTNDDVYDEGHENNMQYYAKARTLLPVSLSYAENCCSNDSLRGLLLAGVLIKLETLWKHELEKLNPKLSVTKLNGSIMCSVPCVSDKVK